MPGEDRLQFLGSAFGLSTGQLHSSRFSGNGTASNGDIRFIYNTASRILSFDSDGNGINASVDIATVNGGLVNNTLSGLLYH